MPPTYGPYRRLPTQPHLLLPTLLSNQPHLRLTPLCRGQLYRAPSESPADSTSMEGSITGSQVRARFPLRWVIVQVTTGHTEGTLFLPDHFLVRDTYHHYVDARSYFDPLPPSPALLLTHTSLARLVLDRSPILSLL